ncbi:hypothetical protein GLAREA_00803 [Glarea lozoyensis ATCC 20868]|uniref:Uncharacterized protein n=1 Tax=Glarea lozoyensis (strain ATCC 20868 / MF5171) TaxID=1116229 RepID=S3DT88_GLAL2|nr:uncharacterized protein GLAREA_00803 [Glarea lozoyensis ATCC 20868]EPE29643.1 hypothetical protein GLAREA_00803 [Glarea lozoyensis ATCC 20868]
MGQHIKETLPYCPGCDREIWKHMVISQENEHRERHLSGDICCSVIFPGEQRETKRERGSKGEVMEAKDSVSEAGTARRGRDQVAIRPHQRNDGFKRGPSTGQRFESVEETMKSGRIDLRDHWTEEARAVAYNYHRYQTGARKGQASGQGPNPGVFGPRSRGRSPAQPGGNLEEHGADPMPMASHHQHHSRQSTGTARIPQGPKAMGYQQHQHSSTASLPSMSSRGPKHPMYEPPPYHWTPPMNENPSNLQSPILFNQNIFVQPKSTGYSSSGLPPAAPHDLSHLTPFQFHQYITSGAVGYLPPPPPPLSSLTDPNAVLACQTNYSPETPFRVMTEAPPPSPATAKTPSAYSPKDTAPSTAVPSPTLQPILTGRRFKISDQEFHGHPVGVGSHGLRIRSSQSEPPCKTDLKAMADLLDNDSADEHWACDTLDEATHNGNATSNKKHNEPVIVSSNMA